MDHYPIEYSEDSLFGDIPVTLTEDEIEDILNMSSAANSVPSIDSDINQPRKRANGSQKDTGSTSSIGKTLNQPRKRVYSEQLSQMDTSSSSSSHSSSDSSSDSNDSDAAECTPSKKHKSHSKRGRPALSGMRLTNGLYYQDGAKLHYNFRRVTIQTGVFVQLPHSITSFSARYANAKIGRKNTETTIVLPQLPFKIDLPDITLTNGTIKDLLTKVQEVFQRSLTKNEMKLVSKSKRRSTTRYIDLLKNTYYAGLQELSTNTWELLLKSPEEPFQLMSSTIV